MKNIILVLASLAIVTLNISVNGATTLYFDNQHSTQNIVCEDCVQPVIMSATGLPNFLKVNGTQMQAVSPIISGQYKASVSIRDGNGKTARIMVFVLCDNTTSPPKQATAERNGNTVINIYSQHLLANLTALLLNPNNLTENQLKIQTILSKEAAINNKIANLLYLIRRYSSQNDENTENINKISKILSVLFPKQQSINNQLLNNEASVSKNRLAISDQLQIILKLREDLRNLKDRETKIQEKYKEVLKDNLKKKGQIEEITAVIELREEYLRNLTSKIVVDCEKQARESRNDSLKDTENATNQLKIQIAAADDEIGQQNDLIKELEQKLNEAKQKRNAAYQKKYQCLSNLTVMNNQKDQLQEQISSQIQKCQSSKQSDSLLIAKISDSIKQYQQQLVIAQGLIKRIQPQLPTLFVQIESAQKQTTQKSKQLDQSITHLELFYDSIGFISEQSLKLKKEKESVDQEIKSVRITLEVEMRSLKETDDAMKNAKEQLAAALQEKEENDKQIQNIIYENLDIIRSLKGFGSFEFDFDQLYSLIAGSSASLDFTQVFEAKYEKRGNRYCGSEIAFYSMGTIQQILPDRILVKSISQNSMTLYTPTCSIILATKQNYAPKPGDAICWKGAKQNNEWVILESIVLPNH